MKITIDTKEDSPDDIRHVVALLSRVLNNSKSYDSHSHSHDEPPKGYSQYDYEKKHQRNPNIFESSSPTLDIEAGNHEERSYVQDNGPPESQPTNAFASMFGESSSIPSPEEPKPELINLDEEDGDDEDIPELMEY